MKRFLLISLLTIIPTILLGQVKADTAKIQTIKAASGNVVKIQDTLKVSPKLVIGSLTAAGDSALTLYDGTNYLGLHARGGLFTGNVDAQGYKTNTTQWMDASINLSNIGTYSGSGAVSITRTTNGATVAGLSGNASRYTYYGLGRAANEFALAVSAGAGQFAAGSVAGDIVLTTTAGALLFDTNNGTGTPALKLATANGAATFASSVLANTFIGVTRAAADPWIYWERTGAGAQTAYIDLQAGKILYTDAGLSVTGAATFASTISSGAITSSGLDPAILISPASGTARIKIFAPSTADYASISFQDGSRRWDIWKNPSQNLVIRDVTASISALTFTGGTGAATFASTISSGAITSSGTGTTAFQLHPTGAVGDIDLIAITGARSSFGYDGVMGGTVIMAGSGKSIFWLTNASASASMILGTTGTLTLGSVAGTGTGAFYAGAATFASTLTLSGSAANIALGANYLSYGGTDAGLNFENNNEAWFTAAVGFGGVVKDSVKVTNSLYRSFASGARRAWVYNTYTGNDGSWSAVLDLPNGGAGAHEHGLLFIDGNSMMGGISVNRINSASNYNSDMYFYTGNGTDWTNTMSSGATLKLGSDKSLTAYGAATFNAEILDYATVSTAYRGNLSLYDNTAIAAGVGGQIVFGGKYTGSTYTEWAGIQGTKAYVTDGNYAGKLLFRTRTQDVGMVTALTIDDAQAATFASTLSSGAITAPSITTASSYLSLNSFTGQVALYAGGHNNYLDIYNDTAIKVRLNVGGRGDIVSGDITSSGDFANTNRLYTNDNYVDVTNNQSNVALPTDYNLYLYGYGVRAASKGAGIYFVNSSSTASATPDWAMARIVAGARNGTTGQADANLYFQTRAYSGAWIFRDVLTLSYDQSATFASTVLATGNITTSADLHAGVDIYQGTGNRLISQADILYFRSSTNAWMAQMSSTAASFYGTLAVTGAATFASTVDVNGSYLNSDDATFTLLSTPTTVNFAGAATTVSIGAGTGTTTVNNDLVVDDDATVTDTLTVSGALGLTGVLLSGTYTPTLTSVTNIASATLYQCQYMRVGNVVTVSGRIDITLTSGSTLSEVGISLPVASNFTTLTNCGGVGAALNRVESAPIMGDFTNDRAAFKWTASAYTTNPNWFFTFTYVVQ